MTKLLAVHLPKRAVLDVVFIHGLDGDARKTWSGKGTASFWPEWLAEDVEGVAVWSVGYDAWSSGWCGRSMPMQDRAVNLMAQLQNHGIGERPLCFVTHSMGGLLAKEILLHAADGHTEFASFAGAARGVVFLATPHTGSGLAKAVTALGALLRGTPAIDDLERNKPYLRHLSDRYRNWVDEAKISNLVFYETHPTNGLRVVDETSANPGLAGVTPIAVDANHIDICKPADRSSLVYGQVKRFVSKMIAALDRPGTWRELPDLPPDVRSLMHAQVRAAQELPYRLPGARRPSLATVYVRQDLGSGPEEPQAEQPAPTPILDNHGRIVDVSSVPTVRTAVRPPARTVREALDGDRHLMITGGPGQGKSTLSLRLAADIANRWITRDDADVPITDTVVPLRLTARMLATRLDLPFAQALTESARSEYGALLRVPLDGVTLSDSVTGYPWLLLVDGLDEVADSTERDRLVSVLSAWASNAPDSPYRVVLTTRPIEGAALAPLQRIGAARYELQPFDDEALRRFAENWFAEVGPGEADRFLSQIREAHLDELVKVPLLATIAAIVFEQHGSRPLPDNQYELYDAYLSFLGSTRTSAPGPFGERRTDLLEHLGRARLETDSPLVATARDWTTRNVPAAELTNGWQDQLVAFLASTGPLVIRGDDLSFLHHSFAEHLAATAVARTLPDRFDPDDDAFTMLLHSARPKETGRHARAVLLHYAHLRAAEADPMLRWMHAGSADQHLLAARLLARHLPAGAAGVDAFLKTVHAWAMTTQHTGGEILRQACRASHHPGLVTWLLGLMRDRRAPWQTRVDTAAALTTRLRGKHTAEAITLLTAIIDDASVPVDYRVDAAEALANSGAGERETADRGLRSILRDPLATGTHCRTAAVVLSAFGPSARTYAVDALSLLITDFDTPTDDLVEASTGLVEIGVEFHERCAEVFLAVLHDPVDSMVGRRDAALGLASLGPQHLLDAVTELTTLISNHRFSVIDRASAAEVLGELGPQHRLTAGELLISMFAEPGIRTFERAEVASRLGQLGPEFTNLAITELRSVISDPHADGNDIVSAARNLADLGPEFRGEAAENMWKVYDDPLTSNWRRTLLLRHILLLGSEPDRQRALQELRDMAASYGADPTERCRAAEYLLAAGPEFHVEASERLRSLTDGRFDPKVAAKAWSELLHFGTTFQHDAHDALLNLITSEGLYADIPSNASFALSSSHAEHIKSAANALNVLLGDKNRSFRSRVSAIEGLVRLGRKYHRHAVTKLCELLQSATAVDPDFHFAVSNFTHLGRGIRAEIAETMHRVARDSRSPSSRRWRAIKVLDRLGITPDPEVIGALSTIMRDESAEMSTRQEAACVLAEAAPDHLTEAIELVFDIREMWRPYDWRRSVFKLAHLGADLAPNVRQLIESDTPVYCRSSATTLLSFLESNSRTFARATSEHLADDQLLEADLRLECWQFLVDLDPTIRTLAATRLRQVFKDENERIETRSRAARELVRIEPRDRQQVAGFLRHNTEDPNLSADERHTSLLHLQGLSSRLIDSFDPFSLALAHDPRTSPQSQRQLLTWLPRKLRTEIEHRLLSDRSVPIADRLPARDFWDDLPLEAEAEVEVRDALAAFESRPRERVDAAAALAKLSWQLIPEATRLLGELVQQRCAPNYARRKLAELSHQARQDVLTWAATQVMNDAQPRRVRYRAASLVTDLTAHPPPAVTDFIHQVAQAERTSDRDRVDALFALQHFDRLRAVRDDERQSPATRWRAATKLLDRKTEDRTAGLALLGSIATNRSIRPALRWRVAASLARLGIPGRDLAVNTLYSMVSDPTLPTTARAKAASALNNVTPSRRRQILTMLSGMSTDNPAHRLHVLAAIADIDPTAAVPELRATSRDQSIGALTRLRYAETLVTLQRNQLETAAVVARTIAHEQSVAPHLRIHAARNLANWSELCRAEARELIHRLTV
ncbi:NACHT domain-containing protein [Actinophytocola sediminis]